MHPFLDLERFTDCLEFINALNECHQRPFSEKMMGVCNVEKEQLSACLHAVRLAQIRVKIEAGKEKRRAMEAKWKESREEAYGKDEWLKEVVGGR